MTSFKLFGAALILLTASATPVFAQVAGLVELPGDYAFFYPDDDFRSGSSAVQPGRVDIGGLRLQTRPHRAHHHISSTRAH
jgi:hypothetical protein